MDRQPPPKKEKFFNLSIIEPSGGEAARERERERERQR